VKLTAREIDSRLNPADARDGSDRKRQKAEGILLEIRLGQADLEEGTDAQRSRNSKRLLCSTFITQRLRAAAFGWRALHEVAAKRRGMAGNRVAKYPRLAGAVTQDAIKPRARAPARAREMRRGKK